jgi:hypothetical protein
MVKEKFIFCKIKIMPPILDNRFEQAWTITTKNRLEMYNTANKRTIIDEPKIFKFIHKAHINYEKNRMLKKGKLLTNVKVEFWEQYKDYYMKNLVAVYTHGKLIKVPRIVKSVYA